MSGVRYVATPRDTREGPVAEPQGAAPGPANRSVGVASFLGSRRHRAVEDGGPDRGEEDDGRDEHQDAQDDADVAEDQAGQGQAAPRLAGAPDLAPRHVSEHDGHDRADEGEDHVVGDPRDQADDGERVGGPDGRVGTRLIRLVRWWLLHCAMVEPSTGARLPSVANLMEVASETIRRRLRAVPDTPGVYLMRDASGQVIYVGKALRLRDRLRSYFTSGYAQTPRVADLVRRVTDFEFVVAANEVEALVLECNLIKHYRPRFNIRLKDDKNYLYLKLPVTQEFPRVHYTRRIQDDGALYFGPYTSAQSLRSTVKSIRQLLPFRTCSDDIFKQGKVCLDFHIRRCPGPCEDRIGGAEYHARINEVALFMEGRSDVLTKQLRQKMNERADSLDFENAARYRDQLIAIEKIADRQKVLTRSREDQDLVAYAREGRDVFVEVAYVRQGKMVGHDGHALEGAGEAPEAELLRAFLLMYYGSATHIP